MKRQIIVLIGLLAFILTIGWIQNTRNEAPQGSSATIIFPSPKFNLGPASLYPNEQMTPGKVETIDINILTSTFQCPKGTCTYSQSHRSVTQHDKTAACNEYPENCKGTHEIDHFIPVCAGGSNDLANLWVQPERAFWQGQDFGFHTKDKLEAWACRELKVGLLTAGEISSRIKTDWVAFYKDTFDGVFGVDMNPEDEDDEIIKSKGIFGDFQSEVPSETDD